MSRLQKLLEIRKSSPAILPSLLLCDFANLEREVERLHEANVPALHLDVMDGVFVPNMTYGLPIVEAFRKLTDLPLDVHLMIAKPEQYVQKFVDAGADVVTFHPEAIENPIPILEKIREAGVAGGIAINPGTTVAEVEDVLPLCDIVCVMSVEAGFGGQKFQESVLDKFGQIRNAVGDEIVLEIDGGVSTSTIDRCHAAGVELFVAGSAIFRKPDYRLAVSELLEPISDIAG